MNTFLTIYKNMTKKEKLIFYLILPFLPFIIILVFLLLLFLSLKVRLERKLKKDEM